MLLVAKIYLIRCLLHSSQNKNVAEYSREENVQRKRPSLDPQESAPKRHLDRFSRFLHSSPCAQHIDHATCDIFSNRPHIMHCVQAIRTNNNNSNNNNNRSKVSKVNCV